MTDSCWDIGGVNMNNTLKLPIGIENYEKLQREGFYYIDKTGLIKELLDNWGKVTLFTRPRRFGKSLNMNMLQYFFEYGCDSRLFEGLDISKEKLYWNEYMGNFPVISVSLKDTEALDFGSAQNMLRSIIGSEALRFQFLSDSGKLSDAEKEQYRQLIRIDPQGRQMFYMSDDALAVSLRVLCSLLHKHYGQKVILLVDEYDVPLAKAQQYGYYEEMVAFIRSLFGAVLKSNNSLYFAILTGCLRVGRESIFTGLNNLQVMSITNVRFSEYFGFTDGEVRTLLDYYGFAEKYELVRTWYDGYRFGNRDIYCPWDVLNYCALLREDPEARPQAFWVNTSGNDIIRNFLEKAAPAARRELERLIQGETITKKINAELTYRDLYRSMDHLWSVLFTTGYLTQREKPEGKFYRLAIPNLEIREIYTEQIQEWFREDVRRDTPRLDAFCHAFEAGDAAKAEELFKAYLAKTISIRDTGIQKAKKENFYHSILLGLLSHREDWDIDSNAESGEGYSDILVKIWEKSIGIVIEVKYPDDGNLEAGCREALRQIQQRQYETRLKQDGMETILRYGIACYKKRCKVAAEE